MEGIEFLCLHIDRDLNWDSKIMLRNHKRNLYLQTTSISLFETIKNSVLQCQEQQLIMGSMFTTCTLNSFLQHKIYFKNYM